MPISLKNTTSILPYLRYSPQANEMTIAGEDNKPRKISFIGKNIAVDIENGTTGWLFIDTGMRSWKPFPINEPPPSSPGANYKRGFSVLVYAPKLLGSPEAFEMCSSTGAHLSFCERLFNEAEPQFGQNNVPIVKIVKAEPIKIGKGKSRELHFEIIKWIPRPAAFVEALAKLKAASGAAPNDAAADAAAQGDDFADDATDDVTDDATDDATDDDFAADTPTAEDSKEEPTAEKPKKSTKKRKQEPPQPEQPKSDILDDDELPDSMRA